MPPRAYWKGYLKLSLSRARSHFFRRLPSAKRSASTRSTRIPGTASSIAKWMPTTGEEVDSENIIKGYEAGKDEYIELDPEELDAVAIESKRVIDIDQFVPKDEIDELYLNSPYYIVPDGEVGQQAFAVIREAIRKEGMVAMAKVMFTSREHIMALEARGKGMLGMTLRYPYEIRDEGNTSMTFQM